MTSKYWPDRHVGPQEVEEQLTHSLELEVMLMKKFKVLLQREQVPATLT